MGIKLIVWIIWGTRLVAAGNDYVLTKFDNNPGLYYEKLKDLRLTRAHWRIVTFVNVTVFQRQRPEGIQHLERFYEDCRKHLDTQCEGILRPHYFQGRAKQIQEKREEIQEILEELRLEARDPMKLPMSIRMKRHAPLSIIGDIGRALFGTLTEDDADYINQEIDNLYSDQKQIAHLLQNQMHLIQNQFQHVDNVSQQHAIAIKELSVTVTEMARNLFLIREKVDFLKYTANLSRWISMIQAELDRFEETTDETIAIIHAARGKRLHPKLLTSQQLHDITSSIIQTIKNLDFPLSESHFTIKDLTEIAVVDIGYHQGRLLLAVYIPLLDRQSYHLYRMHSWPHPQKRNGTGSAYISPRAPYLALSKDYRNYLLITNNYLSGCVNTPHHHICLADQPVYETATTTSCEYHLLIQPSMEAIRHCDIRVLQHHEPYWARVRTLDGWLFSFDDPEPLQILCDNQKSTQITLNGAGVLQLRNGCTARSSHVSLFGMKIYSNEQEYFYAPNITLNLSMISPVLETHAEMIPSVTLPIGPKYGSTEYWHEVDSGKSLSDIERDIGQIVEHHRTQRQQHATLYTGLGITTLLFILSHTFVWYAAPRLRRRVYKCMRPKAVNEVHMEEGKVSSPEEIVSPDRPGPAQYEEVHQTPTRQMPLQSVRLA